MNLFLILPLLSGFFDAMQRDVIKRSAIIDRLVLVSVGLLFSLPLFAGWLFLKGMPVIQPNFAVILFAQIILLSVAFVLTVEAHRNSDFTIAGSYLSLTPAFLLFTSWFLIGKVPTNWQFVGIPILTVGLYILNFKEEADRFKEKGRLLRFLDPFKYVFMDKGSRLMFIVSLIFSVTANLNYLGLESSNIPFFLLTSYAGVSMLCALIAVCKKKFTADLMSRRPFSLIALYGVFFAIAESLAFLGIAFLKDVPLAISLKRTGLNISLFAIGVSSGERQNLRWRFAGMLLMLFGMAIALGVV